MRSYNHNKGGKDPIYQYYAYIHYLTCEQCLQRHGDIFKSLDLAPPIHDGCRCSYLEFPAQELEEYQEKSERMKKKAHDELIRRRLFEQAGEILKEDPSKAVELFQNSTRIEIYLAEVEKLYQENQDMFSQKPDFAGRLGHIFRQAYRDKFGKERYEHMPEGMKVNWERFGLRRIRELFEKNL